MPRIDKVPSGIAGLDKITGGGLPKGRTTLLCGGAGVGKTLAALQFLVNGVREGDPGVILAFEETADDLAKNFGSLGVDIDALCREKKLVIDHVRIDKSEIEETGSYDLEGLFVRLDAAIEEVGARRVVIDTIETIFAGFDDQGLLRDELRRLFRWLKDRGVTSIVTAERGDGPITRYGLEEYVSDCVILLDQRVTSQLATRRLRVVKYRGSQHGTNEYPFLIDEGGLSVLPLSATGLSYEVTDGRVSTGVARLDGMLGGEGYFRGSSILTSGTAGTGKTSLAAHFADASCRRGEKVIFFALEEPPSQIVRNMQSIGVDLNRWVADGRLVFRADRPTEYGIEEHLAMMSKMVETQEPSAVVVDPVSSLMNNGDPLDVRSLTVRLFDFLKQRKITTVVTYLATPGATDETQIGISSLIDTWLQVRDVEYGGERNRVLNVMKSRGMAHSNQLREFVITSRGVDLIDVYSGPGGVLTGSARLTQEASERAEKNERQSALQRKERMLAQRNAAVAAELEATRARLHAELDELAMDVERDLAREQDLARQRGQMLKSRHASVQDSRRKG
ncbi:MAG TPA: circadian clock protein KaiC [Polyangiaceae bacterium]|jgi:circadian clock protein KaiC